MLYLLIAIFPSDAMNTYLYMESFYSNYKHFLKTFDLIRFLSEVGEREKAKKGWSGERPNFDVALVGLVSNFSLESVQVRWFPEANFMYVTDYTERWWACEMTSAEGSNNKYVDRNGTGCEVH